MYRLLRQQYITITTTNRILFDKAIANCVTEKSPNGEIYPKCVLTIKIRVHGLLEKGTGSKVYEPQFEGFHVHKNVLVLDISV